MKTNPIRMVIDVWPLALLVVIFLFLALSERACKPEFLPQQPVKNDIQVTNRFITAFDPPPPPMPSDGYIPTVIVKDVSSVVVPIQKLIKLAWDYDLSFGFSGFFKVVRSDTLATRMSDWQVVWVGTNLEASVYAYPGLNFYAVAASWDDNFTISEP
jgi:hypothetical protein